MKSHGFMAMSVEAMTSVLKQKTRKQGHKSCGGKRGEANFSCAMKWGLCTKRRRRKDREKEPLCAVRWCGEVQLECRKSVICAFALDSLLEQGCREAA